MAKFQVGDRVRIVKFDEEGILSGVLDVYNGDANPIGKVGVIANVFTDDKAESYAVDIDVPNWAELPAFYYASELELDETT